MEYLRLDDAGLPPQANATANQGCPGTNMDGHLCRGRAEPGETHWRCRIAGPRPPNCRDWMPPCLPIVDERLGDVAPSLSRIM